MARMIKDETTGAYTENPSNESGILASVWGGLKDGLIDGEVTAPGDARAAILATGGATFLITDNVSNKRGREGKGPFARIGFLNN